VIYLINKNELL